jgi:hypothetical protein
MALDLDTITIADFKAYFVRDFKYGVDPVTDVTDADIQKAFDEAQINFNQSLFGSNDDITIVYFYLTAHYLVIDLRNADGGLNSTGKFTTQSKSVGSVSESYAVPEKYKNNPTLAPYAATGYGQKYLSLILPRLVGNIASIKGGTTA